MLELDLRISARRALEECSRRGLVVRSERQLAGRAGSHHWHLHKLGRPGTLELSESEQRVWVKVHPRRDGGWATAFAEELAHIGLEDRVPIVERENTPVMFERSPRSSSTAGGT